MSEGLAEAHGDTEPVRSRQLGSSKNAIAMQIGWRFCLRCVELFGALSYTGRTAYSGITGPSSLFSVFIEVETNEKFGGPYAC
ncbi:MAG: hypothetical protein K2Z81_18985 [Cyanobacteria bacterium]|nr:hypothetical protein [Cyanobacteriota bacterium]